MQCALKPSRLIPWSIPRRLPNNSSNAPEAEDPSPPDRGARFYRAPRCDDEGYRLWATALRIAGTLIARRQREVQLVAAVPIPDQDSAAERDLYAFLAQAGEQSLSKGLDVSPTGLSSAFVQLAYRMGAHARFIQPAGTNRES